MLVLGNLTQVAGHQEEEERSQMIGWDPKTVSGDSFPSAEIDSKKSQFLDMVRRRQNQKPSTPGEEDEKISARHEEAIFFKPVLKNSLKSISP